MNIAKSISRYLTNVVWGGFLGVYVDRVLLSEDRTLTGIVLGLVLLGLTVFHGVTEVKEG